jgi:hypothetical protein
MQQAFLSQRCISARPATNEQQNQEERHTAECKGYPCTLGEACHKEGEERHRSYRYHIRQLGGDVVRYKKIKNLITFALFFITT